MSEVGVCDESIAVYILVAYTRKLELPQSNARNSSRGGRKPKVRTAQQAAQQALQRRAAQQAVKDRAAKQAIEQQSAQRVLLGVNAQLRQLRSEKGWTQQQMADSAGVTRQAVTRWFGKNPSIPDVATLVRIAHASGKPLGWFVGEAEGEDRDLAVLLCRAIDQRCPGLSLTGRQTAAKGPTVRTCEYVLRATLEVWEETVRARVAVNSQVFRIAMESGAGLATGMQDQVLRVLRQGARDVPSAFMHALDIHEA